MIFKCLRIQLSEVFGFLDILTYCLRNLLSLCPERSWSKLHEPRIVEIDRPCDVCLPQVGLVSVYRHPQLCIDDTVTRVF